MLGQVTRSISAQHNDNCEKRIATKVQTKLVPAETEPERALHCRLMNEFSRPPYPPSRNLQQKKEYNPLGYPCVSNRNGSRARECGLFLHELEIKNTHGCRDQRRRKVDLVNFRNRGSSDNLTELTQTDKISREVQQLTCQSTHSKLQLSPSLQWPTKLSYLGRLHSRSRKCYIETRPKGPYLSL